MIAAGSDCWCVVSERDTHQNKTCVRDPPRGRAQPREAAAEHDGAVADGRRRERGRGRRER